MFVTTPEFLPQHREHRQQVLQIITAAEARGQTRLAEMNRQVLGNLDHIITALAGRRRPGRNGRRSPMRADNTRHIIDAARHRRELTRAKAIQALRALDADGSPVTFETVARAAGVSRSWLYTQPDLRAEIETTPRASAAGHRTAPVPASATRLRRVPAAAPREPPPTHIRQLAEENRQLRDQLARALGEQRSATVNKTSAQPSRRHLSSGNDRPVLKSHPKLRPETLMNTVRNGRPQVSSME